MTSTDDSMLTTSDIDNNPCAITMSLSCAGWMSLYKAGVSTAETATVRCRSTRRRQRRRALRSTDGDGESAMRVTLQGLAGLRSRPGRRRRRSSRIEITQPRNARRQPCAPGLRRSSPTTPGLHPAEGSRAADRLWGSGRWLSCRSSESCRWIYVRSSRPNGMKKLRSDGRTDLRQDRKTRCRRSRLAH